MKKHYMKLSQKERNIALNPAHEARKRKVICDNKIYNSIKEFTHENELVYSAVINWLRGNKPMPQNWIDRGLAYYKAELKKVCPDQKELADIVVDMVYSEKGYKTSSFAWEMCGETIIENLESRKTVITYPIQAETNNAEFEFDGRFYKMVNEYVDKKQFEEQIIDFE